VTPRLGEWGLRREFIHQWQYRRYSPLGVALFLGDHYCSGLLLRRLRNGRWPSIRELWDSNPLEKEVEKETENVRLAPDKVRLAHRYGLGCRHEIRTEVWI
jgi:hypothetical protein